MATGEQEVGDVPGTVVVQTRPAPLPSEIEDGDIAAGSALALPADPAMAFLRTIEQRVQLASMLVASGLIPQRTPEQAMAVMLAGYEMGLPPMAAFRNIHAIPSKEGGLRLTTSADLALATAQKRYGVRLKQVVQWDNTICRLILARPGFADVESSFTWADAETAELTKKDNWRKWPRAMLASKAKFQGVRMICPEVGAGLYDADELGVETDEEGNPIAQAWVYTPSPESEQQQPVPGASPAAAPACPVCGGAMWDNTDRVRKAEQEGKRPPPQYKCKKKECEGKFWEAPGEVTPTSESPIASIASIKALRKEAVDAGAPADYLAWFDRETSEPRTADWLEGCRGGMERRKPAWERKRSQGGGARQQPAAGEGGGETELFARREGAPISGGDYDDFQAPAGEDDEDSLPF